MNPANRKGRLRHIIEVGLESKGRTKSPGKLLTAGQIGRRFTPYIEAAQINRLLENNGYIAKNDDGKWVVAERGKPFFYSYARDELIVYGAGTIYWRESVLASIEEWLMPPKRVVIDESMLPDADMEAGFAKLKDILASDKG